MSGDQKEEPKISFSRLILEALKGIKSEILLYAVIVAVLLVGSAYFGIDVLREVKWPLLIIFSLALVAYFFARAVPRARANMKKRAEHRNS